MGSVSGPRSMGLTPAAVVMSCVEPLLAAPVLGLMVLVAASKPAMFAGVSTSTVTSTSTLLVSVPLVAT